MAKRKQASSHLTSLPMLPTEAIYIRVDIGKFKHVAGFVSKTLLERHKHFESSCSSCDLAERAKKELSLRGTARPVAAARH